MTAVKNYRDIVCLLRNLPKQVRNFDIKDASEVFSIALIIIDWDDELQLFRLHAAVLHGAVWFDQSTVS